MMNDKSDRKENLKEINKQISKAIRRDIGNYNSNLIKQTIDKNKSMKVFRRAIGNGKYEVTKLKKKQGNLTVNREEILHIVEEFYFELYQSQIDEELDPQSQSTSWTTAYQP